MSSVPITSNNGLGIMDLGRGTLTPAFRIVDHTMKIFTEVVKIAAIAVVIFNLVPQGPSELKDKAYGIVFFAPIAEEIFFRGMLLPALELLQKGYTWIRGDKPSHTDLETQKIWRVRISAVIFGLAHLRNPNAWVGRGIQVCSCILGGISYGHMKEKTNSIALPIIAHAANNAFTLLNPTTRMEIVALLAAVACHDLFWYLYATTPTDASLGRITPLNGTQVMTV